VGGETHDRESAPTGILPYKACGLQPIQDGHLDVHEDQIEGGGLQRLQGLAPMGDGGRLVATLAEQPRDDLLVRGIVFHDEDASHSRSLLFGRGPDHFPGGILGELLGRRRGLLQLHHHVKGAAPADFAVGPDTSPVHLHQVFADGQSQTGPAILPRDRGVGLFELLENHEQLVRRDADAGIPDIEAQFHARRRGCGAAAGMEADAALMGVLDRIAEQVHQHLVQA